MAHSTTSETTKLNNPRIASYAIPASIWILGVAMLTAAVFIRFFIGGTLHQFTEIVLFLTVILNALNFFIPLAAPNTILGGAKFQTFVLAAFALVALLCVH